MTQRRQSSPPPRGGGELAGLARDSGLNLVGSFTSQVAGTVLILVMARSLGDSAVGIYSQAFALRAMLMLFCALGARVSLTHFVARYRADGNVGALRGAVRVGVGVPTLVATVAAAALVIGAGRFADGAFDEPDLERPIQLAGLSLPFFVAMTVALAATQGFKTMRAFAGVGLIFEPMARLLVTIALVAAGFGVVGAMWAVVTASVVAALLAVRALRRYVNRLGPARPEYELRTFARFSAHSWVASIATQGLLWSDVVILGIFVTSAQVGVYQVATRVVLLSSMMTTALTASLAPRVADAWRRSDAQLLRTHYRALTGWTFRLSLPIFVMIAAFPALILRLFGGDFDGGSWVIWWLVGGALVDAVAAPSAVTLNQANYNRVNMIVNLLALAGNIALNLVLIPRFGIEGAAAAWAVSLALPGIARVLLVRRLVTGISAWSSDQGRALGAAFCTFVVVALLHRVLAIHWFAELVVLAVTALVTYVIVMTRFGLAEDDRVAATALFQAGRRAVFRFTRRLEKRRLRARLSRLEKGSEPLRIDELISPFRYDIEVRRQFFEFLASHEHLARHDFDRFVQLARGTDYYTWYSHIAVKSIGVDEGDGDAVDAGFARRVRKSVALFTEFPPDAAFDKRYPITVRRVEDGRVGERKRLTARRYVPVDGCHRLALLAARGRESLDPDEYRLAPVTERPLDNTEELMRVLDVSPDRYVRFMARGFRVGPCEDRDDLLTRIREVDAGLADEVSAIVAIDEEAIASRRFPSAPEGP